MLSLQSIYAQTNISLNKSSTASSYSENSHYAFDGLNTTSWGISGGALGWISVDLGSISSVDHIVFNVEQTPSGDTTHEIYSSVNGINWQLEETINSYTVDNTDFTRYYTNLNGIRYLKIQTTSSPSWVAWNEISVFGTQEPIAPTTGLLAYYPFNNNAIDEHLALNPSATTINNGTVYGATPTTDRFGNCDKAYSFDGVDDYINTTLLQENIVNYSISTWININSYNNSSVVLNARGPENNGNGGNCCSTARSLILTQNNGLISFALNSDFISCGKSTTQPLPLNVWKQITVVFSSAIGNTINPSQFNIYIDGVLATTIDNELYNPYNNNVNAPFSGMDGTKISSWNNQYFFNGKLDDIRIYNTALNQQQVTDLYNAEKPSNLNSQEYGITVITHGFQLTGEQISPTADFEKMGSEIIKRAGGGIMFKNNTTTGQLEIVPNTGDNNYPFDATKEIILVYDWGDISNNGVTSQSYAGNGFLEAAADNLFSSILKLRNPLGTQTLSLDQFLQKPKHIIGHSRGTIVNLQMLHRFLHYFPNTTIEQVTTLDPHPATVFGDMKRYLSSNPNNTVENLPGVLGLATNCDFTGCIDSNSVLLRFPQNVLKADNYYRTDGDYEGVWNFFAFDGVRIPSLNGFNREINNSVLNFGAPLAGGTHSAVHKWYLGTINPELVVANSTTTGGLTIYTAEQNSNNWYLNASQNMPNNFMQNECRTSTGFNYSRIGGRYNQLTSIDPSQKLDINQLNAQLGSRYGSTGEVAPKNIFNGDFSYDNSAGWIKNGGAYDNFAVDVNNGVASVGANATFLRHSLMYFGNSSNNYNYLTFKAKKANTNTQGNIIIKFFGANISAIPTESETIISYSIPIENNLTDEWKTFFIPIPDNLKPSTLSPQGEIGTFSINNTNLSPFLVDDFELTSCIPEANNLYVAMPDPSTLNFADIDNDHWAKEGIYKSRNYGLFRGTSNTTFTPNTSLTKAEAITVLVRAGIKLGIIPTYNTTGLPYADVTSCNQYFPYIQTAKNLGHLEFTSNFNPNSPITVAQLCVYMDKILQINLHDWNATAPNTPWVLAPTSQYIQSQLSQIVINQPETEQNDAMRRILHCIDVVKNDNIIDSYRTQNVWTLKDVENINISSGQTVEVDGTATVTRARMAVASANLFRFVFKKLNNGNAPAGRMANTMNTTNSDPSIDDFIGIGNTFDNKDIPATDTPEAPTQITFNINSGDTLGLQYQSDTDTAGNPQFFYWSMNKNVDSNIANLVSVPINSIQNHRKVSFVAPVVTAPKTWYLYSYLANNKGKIKETVITINVSSTLSTNDVNGILDNVKIYPNPTDNILFIDTLDKGIKKIELFDLQGRLLKTIKENKEKYQIDISNFSSATYLVKLSTEKGSQTVKVVKK